MKIKTKKSSWEEIESLGKLPHVKPIKPPFLFRLLVRALSVPDLMKAHFSFTRSRMDQAGEGPWLILMNHSSFLDLKMASKILFPKPYQIVSTTDAFVGKSLLMRLIGCIPTQKFVTDVSLVMTLIRRLKKDKVSVLMYPEAGYSFDGTATRLPRRLGGLLKRLGVPVVLIRSDAGGFLRDPLYNGLRLRRVKVNATVSCLLTCEEIREKSVEELDGILDEAFSFDHFREQREKGIAITEGTRATGLERVLYRCPRCGAEKEMRGEGITLTCGACGASYEMKEDGTLAATEGETEFSHIPDWYAWERQTVRRELEEGTYRLDVPVSVGVICDHKAMYLVGEGRLVHTREGMTLYDDKGRAVFTQDPWGSHSLNVDFFFYEMGDMIGIGSKDRLYYCFVQKGVPVTKARLAAEEMYEMPKPAKRAAEKAGA